MHTIDVVNPAPRQNNKGKKGKKNVANKKSNKKSSKKSGKKSSGRKSNPKKGGKKRRRRKSNPSFGSMGIIPNFRKVIYMLFGMAFASWGVMRFGSFQGDAKYSQTAGIEWDFGNSVIAVLTGWFGSKLVSKWFGSDAATYFYLGAFMLVAIKLFWTKVIAQIPGGPVMFGQTQIPSGTVRYDDNGNVLIAGNGQWTTMQGYDGLAEATPLGGLAEATPLGEDMTSVQADPWMNGYGHIMEAGAAGSPAADWGGRTWRGSDDPYLAAYS